MKIALIVLIISLVQLPKVRAQEADNLTCEEKKQLILKSNDLIEWRTALLNLQMSKMIRTSHFLDNIHLHYEQYAYDYEWKTNRWKDIQSGFNKKTIINDSLQKYATDSLQKLFDTRSKPLRDKFSLISMQACRQSLFDEMIHPVTDNMKVIRRQFYKNRQ